jgi:YebC/PmpR family DNA-binding regulatory protein
MAGHSKWANIKNRKGAQDSKRGKIFGQVSKLIRIAVKEGNSGDPKFNPALRVVLDKARAANMPKDKIQKAIDRGLGKTASGAVIQEIVYEGYGPGGVGVIVVAMTDNTQRTASEVKSAFSKAGGSLGGPNAAMFMFSRNQEGEYVPTMPTKVEDEQIREQLNGLVESLQESDDVEDVYISAEDSDE